MEQCPSNDPTDQEPSTVDASTSTNEAQGPSIVEMLSKINTLDSIPQLQVPVPRNGMETAHELPTVTMAIVMDGTSTTATAAGGACAGDISEGVMTGSGDDKQDTGGSSSKEDTPRAKQLWHYHLGGVRHCRVPLTAELKEALEVAYVSRIMSKNFRKEGQPEKDRIARITGMRVEKVQEWFKNRRKKDRLLQDRSEGRKLPKGRRGRKSNASIASVAASDTSDLQQLVSSQSLTVATVDPSQSIAMLQSPGELSLPSAAQHSFNPVQEEVVHTTPILPAS